MGDDMIAPVIAYIDEDRKEQNMYTRWLECTHELQIARIDPRSFKTLSDYDRLLQDHELKAFVIDNKIAEYAGTPYEGVNIADFIRSLDCRIPIFILTNFSDPEDPEYEGAVEYIIPKGHLNNKVNSTIHIKRILRAIGRYTDALSEREKIFSRLINKKVTEGLTEEEEVELENVRVDMDSRFALREANALQEMESVTRQRDVQIGLLKAILDGNRNKDHSKKIGGEHHD